MSPETRDRIVAAREGDPEAFEMLVDRYRRPLCAFLFTVLEDYHLAQDVAQEAFLTVYRKLPSLRDPRSFPTWLFRTGLRHAIDMARERTRQGRIADLAADLGFSAREIRDGSGSAPPHDPSVAESRERIRRALRSIRGEWAGTLVLRYYEGMSCREIADVMGIGVENVRVRLHRGRRALRLALHTEVPALGVNDEVRGRRAPPRRPA